MMFWAGNDWLHTISPSRSCIFGAFAAHSTCASIIVFEKRIIYLNSVCGDRIFPAIIHFHTCNHLKNCPKFYETNVDEIFCDGAFFPNTNNASSDQSEIHILFTIFMFDWRSTNFSIYSNSVKWEGDFKFIDCCHFSTSLSWMKKRTIHRNPIRLIA